MTILSALISGFGRMIGRVATTTVGWATICLFGRVPQSTQTVLDLVTIGSVVWLGALIALPLPAVQVFVWNSLPRPTGAPIGWLSTGLLVVAFGLPLLIGLLTARMTEPDRRPTGLGLIWQILRGYAWTAVIATLVAYLAALGLVRKLRTAQRGWQSEHLAVIVKPGRYEAVVTQIDGALRAAGLDLERDRAPRSVELPPRALALIADRPDKDGIPDRFVQFHGQDLSILVLPSDIALLGRQELVVRARSAIARRLPSTDTYLTFAEETEQIEDRLAALAGQPTLSERDLRPIDQVVGRLVVPYDVWETLERVRLQVEHDARPRPGGPVGPRDFRRAAGEAMPAATPVPAALASAEGSR